MKWFHPLTRGKWVVCPSKVRRLNCETSKKIVKISYSTEIVWETFFNLPVTEKNNGCCINDSLKNWNAFLFLAKPLIWKRCTVGGQKIPIALMFTIIQYFNLYRGHKQKKSISGKKKMRIADFPKIREFIFKAQSPSHYPRHGRSSSCGFSLQTVSSI